MSGILHIADQTGSRSIRRRALLLVLPLASVLGYAAHEDGRYTPGALTAPASGLIDSDFASRTGHAGMQAFLAPSPSQAEATFLRQVRVSRGADGGFVVESVLEGSPFDQIGLRRGDVIYPQGTPHTSVLGEPSIEALVQPAGAEFKVYRNGSLTRLQHRAVMP